MTSHPRSPTRNFLIQLRQRKVFRSAVTHLLVSWLLLQVADILLPLLELPADTLRSLVLIAFLGLPVTLVLSWIFELTPYGVRRDHGPDALQKDDRPITNAILVCLGLCAAGALLVGVREPVDPSPFDDELLAAQEVPLTQGVVVLCINLHPSGEGWVADIAVQSPNQPTCRRPISTQKDTSPDEADPEHNPVVLVGAASPK